MRYKFKIRFGDTDAYGIVHHRNYYNYFEEARFQYSQDVFGFDVESKIKFPLTECYCKFKNPIKFTLDMFIIDVECKNIMNSKLEFSYKIMDQSYKKLYAYGSTTHVYVDENGKMNLELPNWIQEKLEKADS